jgi:hypothetical protein
LFAKDNSNRFSSKYRHLKLKQKSEEESEQEKLEAASLLV